MQTQDVHAHNLRAPEKDAPKRTPDTHAHIEAACAEACRMIAPAWPLDRAIAVNPHWSRIGMPLRKVAARMAMLGQVQVFPPRCSQHLAWKEGRIQSADLWTALEAVPEAKASGLTPEQCVEALEQAPSIQPLPLLIDVLDTDPRRHTRLSWREAITFQVSQTCAAYFDLHQADWQPIRPQSFYAFWRDTLQHDHAIGTLMGLPQLGRALDALPATREDAERWVLERLGLPQAAWADYVESVLLTVNGWASWCAYLGWQARLEGREDAHLRELLAARMAWGAILLESKTDRDATRAFSEVQDAWSRAPGLLKQAENALLVDEVWQRALEIGYQRTLAQALSDGSAPASSAVDVQAAFCIDVRSEPIRRALENAAPTVQTIGFAGFFGLPIAYTPLATTARRPQLPGLLAPTLEVTDAPLGPDAEALTETVVRKRLNAFARVDQWRATSRWPSTAFTFVEAAGVSYLGKLLRWLRSPDKPRKHDDTAGVPDHLRHGCRPQLTNIADETKVTLAARILHAMGLRESLAPLVVLVGHGSQSSNNAHAAALDCGACCGQSGEVNARSLALLLNEAGVRRGLSAQGVRIPADTWFVAALHNTTTDELEGFDIDLAPEAARTRWTAFERVWTEASHHVRQERAPRLGLDPTMAPETLLKALRRRANDGAQTRPEWGLANNAALVLAPRTRSRGAALDGRCFLHDYDASQDADGSVLELLMTAPMLVAHWINFQYHASRCDPLHLGSGNKVLHNVVGGHIGVFEGNGGDLRIGLSAQSLNDGDRWQHEPLRLTVVIDAPQEAIDRIIEKHAVVRQLVDNGWLHLWRFAAPYLEYRHADTWRTLALVT